MAVSIRMNPLASFNEGYNNGLQRAQQQGTMAALSQVDTNPTGAANALLRMGNFEGANAIQKMGAERARMEARQQVQPMLDKGDFQGAAAQIATIDPEMAKQLSDLGENGRKLAEDHANKVGAIAFTIRTQTKEGTPERAALVKQSLEGLTAQGIISPQQAQTFNGSDAALQQAESQALGLKGALDQFNSDRTYNAGRTDADRNYNLNVDQFGETKNHNRTLERQGAQRIGLEGQRLGLERQRVDIARAEADNKVSGVVTPAQARKTETDLRKEFNGLPEVKSYRTVAQSAQQVKALAAQPASPQNDIALIYSVMKAYDPTSVVRETEFATAQNAASVPDQIRNSWNKALKGQRLNPRQRQEMAAAVSSVAASAGQRYNQIEAEYRSYASDYGANPDRVAASVASTPQASTNSPPKVGTISKGYRYNGGDPSNPKSWTKAQ